MYLPPRYRGAKIKAFYRGAKIKASYRGAKIKAFYLGAPVWAAAASATKFHKKRR